LKIYVTILVPIERYGKANVNANTVQFSILLRIFSTCCLLYCRLLSL